MTDIGSSRKIRASRFWYALATIAAAPRAASAAAGRRAQPPGEAIEGDGAGEHRKIEEQDLMAMRSAERIPARESERGAGGEKQRQKKSRKEAVVARPFLRAFRRRREDCEEQEDGRAPRGPRFPRAPTGE